jgi:hypothetical protein
MTQQPRVGRCVALLLLTVVIHACGSGQSSTTSPTSPSSPTISSLSIAGTVQFTATGQTGQLTATATWSDGTTQNVSSLASWQSSNASLATVSATGLVTVVATASAAPSITATYQGKSATVALAVSITAPSSPNLTGTWQGTYWFFVLGSSNGQMTWKLTQAGSTFSGTMTIVNDTLLGTVTGSVQGTFKTTPHQQEFSFTVNVPSNGISGIPGCGLSLVGDSDALGTAPSYITTMYNVGSYKGSFCGSGLGYFFGGFDGMSLELKKQ